MPDIEVTTIGHSARIKVPLDLSVEIVQVGFLGDHLLITSKQGQGIASFCNDLEEFADRLSQAASSKEWQGAE